MKQIFLSSLLASACALALGIGVTAVPDLALAQVSLSITLAPPAMPVYEQPVLAEEGGIWAPGYWGYGRGGYFWVPGSWVQPPEVGLLWTPGYWGWGNGGYAWNDGYWGPTVGFYGGINYGFGYSGRGYEGGEWQGRNFYYNTAVSHVNVANVHNTYTRTVVNNATINRVSYNGGTDGVRAQPTPMEQAAERAPHQPATAMQVQHRQAATANHSPALGSQAPGAASAQPAEFRHANAIEVRPERAEGQQRKETAHPQAPEPERTMQPSTSGGGSARNIERRQPTQTQASAQGHAAEPRAPQEPQEPRAEGKRESPHP